jgi:hypothetical protein
MSQGYKFAPITYGVSVITSIGTFILSRRSSSASHLRLGIGELYWVVLSCIELHWVVLSCIELYWVVLSCIELYWVVLSCIELYWVVLSCIELHWVVLSCIELYWVVLSCIELYWVVLSCIEFCGYVESESTSLSLWCLSPRWHIFDVLFWLACFDCLYVVYTGIYNIYIYVCIYTDTVTLTHGDYWRVLSSGICFPSYPQVISSVILLYSFRQFERQVLINLNSSRDPH